MSGLFRQLDVEQIGDVYCVRLRHARLPLGGLEELLTDIDELLTTSCRKLVFSLGPEEPQCLYSIFLAKLVTLQRCLQSQGGALKFAEASDAVLKIFEACSLRTLFDFVPDRATAIAALNQ
jgi:hypothetical protein